MLLNKFVAAHSVEYVMQLEIFPEWSMGGRYETTNRGKDEKMAYSTHISRSMGEGIREE